MKSQVIVLVESIESFRNILGNHLGRNYQIKPFNGQEHALMHLEQLNPQLIIYGVSSDTYNPESFIEEVRQRLQVRHIPIIALYSRSQSECVVPCYRAGADVCLEKPFGLEILPEVVDMAIRNRELAYHYSMRKVMLPDHCMVKHSDEEVLLIRMNRFIRDNLDNVKLHVACVAEELAMSVSQLDRKIVRLIGVTPKQYIRDYRLKVAFEMLAEHQANITEVAALTGFKNVSYFSTKFRQRYGHSPSQFKFPMHVVHGGHQVNYPQISA
ncbi:MAG: hypothetical protein C0424_10230 [Sphingobacteriaceae bacterium]|nr:hypothetical protein [Sphingobacteriaceae bacterium]